MLHDAGDDRVDAVAHGVHLDFGAHNILIDQNRVLLRNPVDNADLIDDILILIGNLHALSAKDVARAHQDRVPQFVGSGDGFVARKDGAARSARNLAGI